MIPEEIRNLIDQAAKRRDDEAVAKRAEWLNSYHEWYKAWKTFEAPLVALLPEVLRPYASAFPEEFHSLQEEAANCSADALPKLIFPDKYFRASPEFVTVAVPGIAPIRAIYVLNGSLSRIDSYVVPSATISDFDDGDRKEIWWSYRTDVKFDANRFEDALYEAYEVGEYAARLLEVANKPLTVTVTGKPQIASLTASEKLINALSNYILEEFK